MSILSAAAWNNHLTWPAIIKQDCVAFWKRFLYWLPGSWRGKGNVQTDAVSFQAHLLPLRFDINVPSPEMKPMIGSHGRIQAGTCFQVHGRSLILAVFPWICLGCRTESLQNGENSELITYLISLFQLDLASFRKQGDWKIVISFYRESYCL